MRLINVIQKMFIASGIGFLFLFPLSSFFVNISTETRAFFYSVSFVSVFVLMLLRPLADIYSEFPWLKRFVLLRKGLGILSASIIIGFALENSITPGSSYFSNLFSWNFFSLHQYAVISHLGDISGLILLLTSNVLSQRILKRNWKRVQKLSYVYFYSGAVYEGFFLSHSFALYALLVVTNITVLAWWSKVFRRESGLVLQEA